MLPYSNPDITVWQHFFRAEHVFKTMPGCIDKSFLCIFLLFSHIEMSGHILAENIHHETALLCRHGIKYKSKMSLLATDDPARKEERSPLHGDRLSQNDPLIFLIQAQSASLHTQIDHFRNGFEISAADDCFLCLPQRDSLTFSQQRLFPRSLDRYVMPAMLYPLQNRFSKKPNSWV